MGLLDSVANVFTGGMASGITGGGMPRAAPAELDPATKALLDQKVKRAGQSQEEYSKELTSGTQGAAGAMQRSPEQINRSQSSLGMNNPGLGEALSQRSQRLSDANLSGIQAQARAMAPLRQAQETAAAQGAMMDNQQAEFRNTQTANKDLQNRLAARNQIIGSVMGIGASIAGGGIGGKSARSAAGNQSMQNMGTGYGDMGTSNVEGIA